MKDSSNELKKAYYNALQDNISLNGSTVDVFEIVAANQTPPFIYMADFEAVDNSNKDNYGFDAIIGFSVVTKYTNATGGATESDSIVNQILKLVRAKTQLSGLVDFEIITTKVASTFQNKTTDASGTTVTRVIRLEHYIDQIGGDLPRITDLAAAIGGSGQIDLNWTNVANNTGYRIEKSADLETWALLDTVLTDVVTYSDTGLAFGTYYYRVRAFDSSGGSPWSNIATQILKNEATPSGIAYLPIPYSGTLVSYDTNDEYSQLINGFLDRTPPAYPLNFAELDKTALNPFYTLKENNTFGNKERFTNLLGVKSVLGDTYAIDHLHGIGYDLNTLPTDTQPNQILAAESTVLEGFNDFHLASVAIYFSVKDYNESGNAGLPDFFNMPSESVYTSTHRPLSANVMVGFSVGQILQQVPTGDFSALVWRKHY